MTAESPLRRSFEVEGFRHGNNPIPAVSRIGGMIASGGIPGRDLETGALGATLNDQCRLMFALMEMVLAAAGAGLADVLKVTVYLKPGEDRGALNAAWLVAFPDEHSRPVRHVLNYDHLPGDMLIQCEFLAVADAESAAGAKKNGTR